MAAELELTTTVLETPTSSSPNLLPTPISSCFSENRSVSGVSSISSQSNSSDPRRSVSGSTSRRRGYVRPQGAAFAPSAQQRESVMSLGSIAHLQYYFARTGLLDGKGGQMAKKLKNGQYDIPKISDKAESESPIDEEVQLMWEAMQEDGEDIMLPPTVSTYSHRQSNITPLPDQKSLKRELVESLENSLQAIEACEKAAYADEAPTQGFHELQGLHVLDTTTLAIKAARDYYTQHPHPERMNSIRPVQQLRKELYSVLEVLKKCAARNFEGGFREDERLAVLVWVSDVGMMIDREAKLEEKERKERKDWGWMYDSKWAGRESERDMTFLHFLAAKARPELRSEPTPTGLDFFRRLADGRDLNRMHNAAVKESKRQFHLVESWHEDIGKPYRRADNLRYWVKAAELRWEIKLKLDVMSVANQKEDIWDAFEAAVRSWAKHVRAELAKDWNGEEERKLHARAKSLALASPIGSPAKRHVAKMSREKVLSGSPGPSPASSTASLSAAMGNEVGLGVEEVPPVPPIPSQVVVDDKPDGPSTPLIPDAPLPETPTGAI